MLLLLVITNCVYVYGNTHQYFVMASDYRFPVTSVISSQNEINMMIAGGGYRVNCSPGKLEVMLAL